MKAKQLAKQIYNDCAYNIVKYGGKNATENAKSVALICVDAIIEHKNLSIIKKPFDKHRNFVDGEYYLHYWQNVKAEIELL